MSEWKELRIGDVCQVGDGAHAKVARQKSGVLYLTSKNFEAGRLNLDTIDFISQEDYDRLFSSKSQAIRKPRMNDVLMGIIGTFGNAYKYKKTDCFGVSSSVAVIRPDISKLNPDFLVYILNSENFKFIHRAYSSGSVQGYSNIPTIKSMPIVIPSLQTQQKIVGILRCLDAKIENLRRQNETLERIAQTLFKHWFIDFEFPNEKGEPYRSSGGAMQPSELGEIPAGWRVGNLGSEFDISIGRTPPRKEPEWFSTNNQDVKWISIKDMGICGTYILETSEYLTREAIAQFNVPVIPSNTVILSFKLTVGRVAITLERMLSNEAIAHLKLGKFTSLTSEYIYLFLSQFNFDRLGSTSSIAKAVNSQSIKALELVVPSPEIIMSFHQIVQPLFFKLKGNAKQIQTLTKTRDTLLPKLMNGQIRLKS